MFSKIQIYKSYTFYIILILSIIVLNLFQLTKVKASNYEIENIIITENFNKNFKKKDLFDKAFRLAFNQLTFTLLTSSDKKKIQNIDIFKIKGLINSFNIKNEKFINDNYSANFSVSFHKKNTLSFFVKKNIFPSIPKKIDLLLIPIIINKDKNEIKYFSDNEIYKNWNLSNEKFHLINYILPTDEIEDREIINKNYLNIESLDFKNIINKYNINNYIIIILNEKTNNEIQILSKIYMNNNYQIINLNYKDFTFKDIKNIKNIINDLKIRYEDIWKKYNIINTSIKLPITINIDSKLYNQIEMFETFIESFDLVSSLRIIKFNNNYITYKLIFNGSPSRFFNEAKKNGFFFNKENQNWYIK